MRGYRVRCFCTRHVFSRQDQIPRREIFASEPPSLGKSEIPVSNIAAWEQAKRRGNVLRNWVTDFLAAKPLQSPDRIADAMNSAAIDGLWVTIEPDDVMSFEISCLISLTPRSNAETRLLTGVIASSLEKVARKPGKSHASTSKIQSASQLNWLRRLKSPFRNSPRRAQ